MKPERLILSAWGPYPEEEDIDFLTAGENGLFLITGPTGSGKTTLFDGISFALFGEVSGSVRENNSLRSDFALPERETFVRLVFLHRNQQYEIYRSPRYERPKKRGSGTVSQAEKAEMFCNDVLAVSGAKEVTEAVHRLLGLDAEQFKQISMIAQGEFQKLLIAGGKERTQIFRTIFHTKSVESITKLLSEQAKSLYASYNNLVQRIQEAVGSIEPEEDEELKRLCEEKAEGEKLLPMLMMLVKKEKESYRKCEKELDSLREETEKAAMIQESRKRRLRLTENLSSVETELTEMKQGLFVQQQKLEELKKEQAEEKLSAVEEAIAALKEKKEACRKWRQEKSRLLAQENELKDLQEQYLLEEQREKEKQTDYEQAFSLYRRMSAGILARDLKDGEPCPVCGAVHHPQKAEETQAISKAELDQAKAAWDRQREKTGKLHEKTAECYAQVLVYKERLEKEAEQLADEAVLDKAEAGLLEKQKYYRQLKKETEELQKKLEEIRILTARRQAKKEALEQELSECPLETEEFPEEKLSEYRRRIESLTKEKERLHSCMIVNEKAIRSIQDKLQDVTELRKRYGIVTDVEQLIKGNNPKRLIWEQYVLSVYFDTMLHAANLRLAPMSDGRYEMFRVESVGDLRSRDSLEIEVLDHYTGKRRSARSLSGGEVFKASLSLALGMSDMIQSFAGGIEVDALFIDEGFGALDSQSLDQALNVLQGLSKKSCMIGIISHVQELKDRIEKQIVIEKTNTGSRVKGIR